MAEGRVLDQRDVVVLKAGPAKCIPAQGTEAPVVRPCASRKVNRNGEKGGIVGSSSKIVFAHRVMRGECWLHQQVGTIRSARTHSGLLNSRIDREGRPAHQRGDVQELPTASHRSSQWPKEADSIQRQQLDHAGGKDVGYVKGGWPFVGTRIPRILRQSLEDHASRAEKAA